MDTHIAREEIERLAQLSRVALSEDEQRSLQKDLSSIVGYVSELSSVVVEEGVDREETLNTLREDVHPHESGLYTETLLSAVPKREGDRVAVKQIIVRDHDSST